MIYSEEYARHYQSLYLDPWQSKHETNVRNLRRILVDLPRRDTKWLDLACGQAWQFSKFLDLGLKVGVDLSFPQLKRARKSNPDALFVRADISDVGFPKQSFDLVTNFWAGYCYLDSFDLIESLMKRAAAWTRRGGAIYFEVLPPGNLRSFNQSRYAEGTGFFVSPRKPDFTEWFYEDLGGRHYMTSPPVELFVEALTGSFTEVRAEADSGFMVHLIARNKCELGTGPQRSEDPGLPLSAGLDGRDQESLRRNPRMRTSAIAETTPGSVRDPV